MNLRRLKIKYPIKRPEFFEIELLYLILIKLLNTENFRSGLEENGISFQKKIITITNSTKNKRDAWIILREGNIKVIKVNNEVLVIWNIKLDTLYFLSFLFGLMIGFAVQILFTLEILEVILIVFLGVLLINLIGVLIITLRINDLNKTWLK